MKRFLSDTIGAWFYNMGDGWFKNLLLSFATLLIFYAVCFGILILIGVL